MDVETGFGMMSEARDKLHRQHVSNSGIASSSQVNRHNVMVCMLEHLTETGSTPLGLRQCFKSSERQMLTFPEGFANRSYPSRAKSDGTPKNSSARAPVPKPVRKVVMYLKLRWARFFTLAGWNWTPVKQPGFDFLVEGPGLDTDDNVPHSLLIRICEKTHGALVVKHTELWDVHYAFSSTAPALFGDGPKNTFWQMRWGSGGVDYSVSHWGGMDKLWERAAHD